MIRFRNLTKSYGTGRGVFDLSFEIGDGEVFGCLGPEGAGKTTLLSLLMGFCSPVRGWCSIHGKNCHDHQKDIQRITGYLPEHPEFPEAMNGMQFIRFQAALRGIKSMEKALSLADRLELDLDQRTSHMTRSEKQCLGLTGALLHDPEVILLDEPTEGVEPLLRQRFAEILQEEKRRKKTIIWASQSFEDMGRVCDRIGMLKNGGMIHLEDIGTIRMEMRKAYVITFESEQEAYRFVREDVEIRSIYGSQVTVVIRGDMVHLIRLLNSYQVVAFEATVQSLEDIFGYFYGG